MKTFILIFVILSAVVSQRIPFGTTQPDTRTIEQIYQAALQESGSLTVWHGGDEADQQDALIAAFERAFPGIKLNLTVDLSKYVDSKVDQQLFENNLECDMAILQTLHDYDRWKSEGVLMSYMPTDWDQVYPQFKDPDGYWLGFYIYYWSGVYNTKLVNQSSAPINFNDYLKPEFNKKIVLTYPNDDDAVLFLFDMIIKKYGFQYMDQLISQNPVWVRGTETPATLVANGTYGVTFTSSYGLYDSPPVGINFPTTDEFVTWPQTGAIFKAARNPESAKLMSNFLISQQFQSGVTASGWSVRQDIPSPKGYPNIFNITNTNVTAFHSWMMDRAYVERLRFWVESKIGTAQGPSPIVDGV